MENIFEVIKKEGDGKKWTYVSKCGLQMSCEIIRNHMGSLCGYVEIFQDNELFGRGYDEISEMINFYPHGGLTYANFTESGWQIGFDCSHSGDLVPEYYKSYGRVSDVYRTMDYVKTQCELLAEELSNFSKFKRRIINLENLIKD